MPLPQAPSAATPPVESTPMPAPMPMTQATGNPETLSPAAPEAPSHPPHPSNDFSGPIIIEGTSPSPHPLSSSAGGVVKGFANHVPLAVALREILPQGYGFSIDQNVDLGVLVSFTGGKSWRDTLREALEPAGLVMREQGQMVSIGYPAVHDESAAGMEPMAKPKPSFQNHFLSQPQPSSMTPIANIQPTIITGKSPGLSSGSVLQSWDAERGDSLRKVMEAWSRRADIEIDWMSEYDYPLQASVHLTGTFEDAVRNLLTGFEAAHPQPVAELHSNSRAGQTVLVVTTRGNAGD
jgi:hypothetical protein